MLEPTSRDVRLYFEHEGFLQRPVIFVVTDDLCDVLDPAPLFVRGIAHQKVGALLRVQLKLGRASRLDARGRGELDVVDGFPHVLRRYFSGVLLGHCGIRYLLRLVVGQQGR